MSANTVPIFPLTPNWQSTPISSAITTRTVSGVTGLVNVFTAGASGSRIDSITMLATGTTTAGVIRLWKYDGTGNATLLAETLVTAITPSTSIAVWSAEQLPVNFVLKTGQSLYASPHNAEAFVIHVRGGDY